ncbi:MAG: hypothetical protein GY696_23490 [Gammaproteobacteria bacterium]|nr:hypothetical protein [Gammaproteobacteria bacterium]
MDCLVSGSQVEASRQRNLARILLEGLHTGPTVLSAPEEDSRLRMYQDQYDQVLQEFSNLPAGAASFH